MKISGKNVLITGGAGFIGSTLADKLLEKCSIVVIDNFDDYYPKAVKEQNIHQNTNKPNYKFVEGDVRDFNIVHQIVEDNNIDIIFHLAARPGVRPSIVNPYIYFDINVNGTISVLKTCLNSNVKKLIFGSSSSVYGDVELPMKEDGPTNPISPYGVSKLAAEKLCLLFEKLYGIKTLILRYFTVYGPRQRPDEAICKFAKLMLNNQPITIYGNGKQGRDFTFIDDIVNGTILAAEKDISGEIFNLGSGKKVTVNQVVDLLEKNIEKKCIKTYASLYKGEMKDTLSDITKAKKLLEYEPKIPIEDGIKKFCDWVKLQHFL